MINVLYLLIPNISLILSALAHKLVNYWKPLTQMQSNYVYVPIEKKHQD